MDANPEGALFSIVIYFSSMNREKLLKHPLSLIASIFIFLLIFDRLGLKLPISVLSQDRGAPLVVEGEGKVTVVPDIGVVNLGIEETGRSLAETQKSVSQKSQDLVGALKRLGIEEKDVKTTAYNIFPEYNYGGGIVPLPLGTETSIAPAPGRLPTISGYRVSISYEVKVKDLEKINEVLTTVTGEGANLVGNVSFEVNEDTKNEKLTEAREEAVNAARVKAQSLARAAGISLGKIINISESTRGGPIPVAFRQDAGTEEIKPEIEPGETEFTVFVSVSWEIR